MPSCAIVTHSVGGDVPTTALTEVKAASVLNLTSHLLNDILEMADRHVISQLSERTSLKYQPNNRFLELFNDKQNNAMVRQTHRNGSVIV